MTNLGILSRGRAALIPMVAAALSLATGGCGDEEAVAESAEPQVVLEVQAPVAELGVTIANLDYQIACDAQWSEVDEGGVFIPAALRQGTMELVGPARTSSGDELVNVRLWSAAEEPLDGLCLLNLIGRDEQQQSVCASTATFQATDGQSALVDAIMECTEFPVFIGDLSVDAETPELVNGLELQTVEFTIACDGRGTAFFDGMSEPKTSVQINGNLEVIEAPGRSGMAVQELFLDLPTGPCTVQLRARDGDGEVRCTADDTFIIAPTRTTTAEMVVRCGG